MAYLEEQQKAGNHWVVFEGYELADSVYRLHAMASAIEAQSFCDGNGWVREIEDGSYREASYHFHAIENLLREYRSMTGIQEEMKATIEELKSRLQEQSLEINTYGDSEDLLLQLGIGRIVPARRSITLIPEQVIDSFHIALHHHQYAGGLIYELGHSAELRLSFTDKDKAHEAFLELSETIPQNSQRSMTELLLIGSFKGEQLQLDMEGFPLYYTGLVLSTAGRVSSEVKIEAVRDLTQTINIEQRFFIRFDETHNCVLTLDDHLQVTSTSSQLRSYCGYNFMCYMSKENIERVKLQNSKAPKANQEKDLQQRGKSVRHGKRF